MANPANTTLTMHSVGECYHYLWVIIHCGIVGEALLGNWVKLWVENAVVGGADVGHVVVGDDDNNDNDNNNRK